MCLTLTVEWGPRAQLHRAYCLVGQTGSSMSRNNKMWVGAVKFQDGMEQWAGTQTFEGGERKLLPLCFPCHC